MAEGSIADELVRLAGVRNRFGCLALAQVAAHEKDQLLATALWLASAGFEDNELQALFAVAAATHVDHVRANARLIETALPLLARGATETDVLRRLTLAGLQMTGADMGSPFQLVAPHDRPRID
jgi:hypothetical protein